MAAFLVLVFSLITPVVVSWIKRSGWPDWAKVLLTLAVSLVGGALTALATGELVPSNIAGTGGVIFTLAVTFYKTYFQATQVNQQLTGPPEVAPKRARAATFVRPTTQSSLGRRGRTH